MADALIAASPLATVLSRGRHGHATGPPGVRLAERVVGGAISLAARAAGTEALAAVLGWELPTRPRWWRTDGSLVLWTGPERWLILSDTHIEHALRTRIGAAGSLADQSDSRVVLDLSGPRLRDALAKGVSIDLHPRALAVGDVAATMAAHIPVLLWQEEPDCFSLAVARSFAGSLVEWLRDSSLQYGFQVA